MMVLASGNAGNAFKPGQMGDRWRAGRKYAPHDDTTQGLTEMKIHICRYDARGALAASSTVGIVAINEMEFDEETTDGNPAVAITVEQIDGGTIVYTKIADEETSAIMTTIVGTCELGHVLTATTDAGSRARYPRSNTDCPICYHAMEWEVQP